MNHPYLTLQLGTTRALMKFIRDHNGHIDKDLSACLENLEKADTEAAVRHAQLVKPHGMGGITDWFPEPICVNETVEYNEVVLRSLTNEWCRAISLSFEGNDQVSRTAQKGELEARVRSDGYTVCPFCGRTFSTLSKSSWDGTKHLGCGVRLKMLSSQGE